MCVCGGGGGGGGGVQVSVCGCMCVSVDMSNYLTEYTNLTCKSHDPYWSHDLHVTNTRTNSLCICTDVIEHSKHKLVT